MNSKVSIPTIGTILVLAKDWTFTCVAEYRNDGLMNYLRDTKVIPVDSPRFTADPELCGYAIAPSEPYRRRIWNGTEEMHQMYPLTMHCRLLPGHEGDHQRHFNYPREHMRYACTFPRGTRLRVDRIYIRKGAAAYDSLTFWAIDLKHVKKSRAVRFWARLSEVNTMVVTDAVTVKPRKAKPQPLRAILLRD